MTPTITLARYIQTGDIIHIKSADNGLNCKCECVKCGEKLEAIQGPLRTWHFRHNTNKNCDGGQESALHQLAKEIVRRSKNIRLNKSDIFEYDNATLERPIDKFKADVVVSNSNAELVIEIAVTHLTEKIKEDYFKNNKINSIEIDLRKVDTQISQTELEDLIINQSRNKRTIYPTQIKKSDNGDKEDNSWIIVVIVAVLGFLGLRHLCKNRRR